jgi:hypothetical protein
MNRKLLLIYPIALLVFIVAMGMFAFTEVSTANAGPAAQDTAVAPTIPTIQVTVNPPAVTQVVPVTGNDQAGPNILTLLFYGFLGLLAIVLLVALFASANRTTYVRRDGPPPPPDDLP